MLQRSIDNLPATDSPHSWERRERELRALSPLHLAGLIIDYGIFLQEYSDPVDLVLEFEFGPEGSELPFLVLRRQPVTSELSSITGGPGSRP